MEIKIRKTRALCAAAEPAVPQASTCGTRKIDNLTGPSISVFSDKAINLKSAFTAFGATIKRGGPDDCARAQIVKSIAAGGANDLIAVERFGLTNGGILGINCDMKTKGVIEKIHSRVEIGTVLFSIGETSMQELMRYNINEI